MHDADGVAMALPSGKSQHVYISHVGGEEEQAALLEEWLWRQGLVTCRGAPDRVVAVSYTHLTLPTICSV